MTKFAFGNRQYIYRVVVSFLSIVCVSCASLPVAQLGQESAGLQGDDEDERKLWEASAELSKVLEQAGLLYRDSALEYYFDELAAKLLQNAGVPDRWKAKVRIIKHPLLNALAAPDGQIFFHTGLLARLENEAQFAVILGHELTHYFKRHALQEKRLFNQRTALIRILQVTLALGSGAFGGPGVAAAIGSATEQAGALWALAAVSGHSQKLESEADVEGFRLLLSSGYDFDEAPKVFQHLREEKTPNMPQTFFFATHPKLDERIAGYRRLVAEENARRPGRAGGAIGAQRYLEAVRTLQLDNAAMDLELGRIETAGLVLDRHLKHWPTSARGHYLKGLSHYKSGRDEKSITSAIDAFLEAIRLQSDYADAYRDLGRVYQAQRRPQHAAAALQRYLELKPEALDAPIIRGYLAELRKSS